MILGRVSSARHGAGETDPSGRISYALAVLIGGLVVFYLMPLGAILGDGGIWRFPTNDVAQTLTGHLGFQQDGWRFPLLLAPSLMWPHGASVAMTDSAPLVSLVGKVLAEIRGQPLNLMGIWLAACWFLQPVAAVYALRAFGCRSWEAALAAAIITPFYPALLTRLVHVPLCGHFLLLIALGQSARMLNRDRTPAWRDWVAPFLVQVAAVLIHPYLFVYAAALHGAPVVQALLYRRRQALRPVVAYVVISFLAAGIYLGLSGTAGNTGGGYGFYSMNLLSPFWPQRSGLFGRDLPVIDATGGQYEGFNYLGAGVLLLTLSAAIVFVRRGSASWRIWAPLMIVLVLLTLHAVTQVVYAGHTQLLYLGWRPWNLVFGFIQSSGRAFWPVGYAIVIAALAILSRHLSPGLCRSLFVIAVLAQLVDAAPLAEGARAMFSGAEEQSAPPSIPSDTTLLRTLPICTTFGPAQSLADTIQLAAARRGIRLGFTRLSRNPARLDCDQALADALETPLKTDEVRVFVLPSVAGMIRQTVLGPGAQCRMDGGIVLCTRGQELVQGVPLPPGSDLPNVMLPAANLSGPPLSSLLSFGWHIGPDGVARTTGPWATLLFRVTPDGASKGLRVSLHMQAVGRPGNAIRRIMIAANDRPTQAIDAGPQGAIDASLSVPAAALTDGVVRVTLLMTGASARPAQPASAIEPGPELEFRSADIAWLSPE